MNARSLPRWCLIGALLVFGSWMLLVPVEGHAQTRTVTPPAAPGTDSVRTSAKAQALLVRGLTRAYVEDYASAIEHYEQALEHAPNAPAILSALADAHAEQGDRTSALYYARQAVHHGAKSPQYLFHLAELQRSFRQFEDAVATYERLLENHPNHPQALRALAETQVELHRPTDALATYERLMGALKQPQIAVRRTMLDLYRRVGDSTGVKRSLHVLADEAPRAVHYRLQLARYYAQNDQVDAAIDTYQQLLRQHPTNAEATSELAALYRTAGQPQRADSLMQHATAIHRSPDQLVAQARTLIQNAALDTPHPDSAAARNASRFLHQALTTAPEHSEALALLGSIQFHTQRYADAGSTLTRALEVNPRSPDRWAQAATAFLRAHAPQQALDVAEEGLLLFPGQAPLVRAAARALFRVGRHQEALTYFEEALSLLDDSQTVERAQIQAALGRLHRHLGNDAAAQTAFADALDTAPEDPVVARRVASDLAARQTDLDRALSLAQHAVAADSSDARALHALGWVYLQRNRPDAAEQYLRRAAATGRASAAAYEHLGDVYQALGNTAAARRYWQQALDRDPDRASVQEKLTSLPK